MDKEIKISFRMIIGCSYLYMLIPIWIFFIGWLKWYIAAPAFLMTLVAFIRLIKKEYKKEYFKLSLWGVIICVSIIIIWTYFSGVGGFWLQKHDWNWRNALLRDLIDYSWPVQYPETGYHLVYYFVFFLVPAFFGKIFGIGVANVVLLLWTAIGIIFTMLLLYRVLKIETLKKMLFVLLIFITWEGLDLIGYAIADISGYATFGLADGFGWPDGVTGFQYTPNNALLQWVTNQSVIAWVGMAVFLSSRSVRIYAFLGLCVVAFSPLPFIGMVIFLVVDAIYQFVVKYRTSLKNFFIDLISLPNIAASITIFPVFLMFYMANTATNGSEGVGGVGWYINPSDFTTEHLKNLILFWIVQFLCYSIILFKKKKKNHLFWIVNISLLLFPLFRVGEARDLCMRGSIPALFVLMVMVMQFLIEERKKNEIKYSIMTIFIGFSIFSIFADYGLSYKVIRDNGYENRWSDEIVSFSNKDKNATYTYCTLRNFLSEKNLGVFSKIKKKKEKSEIIKDLRKSKNFLKDHHFELVSGQYYVSPKCNLNSYLSYNEEKVVVSENKESILMSDTIKDGLSIFGGNKNGLVIEVLNNIMDEMGEVIVATETQNESQLFRIEKHGEYFLILWKEYALTYERGKVYLSKNTFLDSQLWNFILK